MIDMAKQILFVATFAETRHATRLEKIPFSKIFHSFALSVKESV